MKTQSKTEAKKLAKAYSYNKEYADVLVYVIYCSRTEKYCRYQWLNTALGKAYRLLRERDLYL